MGVGRIVRILAGVLLAAALSRPAAAFDLEGHRGTRGLAPENTLAAFRKALAIGVTTLETDLAVTRDNILVLSHEPYLSPALTRDEGGRFLSADGPDIHAIDLATLRRYDVGRLNPNHAYGKGFPEQVAADGERVPTLDELFALAREHGSVRLNLETKITPEGAHGVPDVATFVRLVLAAIDRSGLADRITV
ncbi:MAG: glycerophosphodiester phosphodiesterase family protein, partial [Clostridia bacterium]